MIPCTACPFCGHAHLAVFAGRRLPHMVVCLTPACMATGPEAPTQAEAWTLWQQRAEQPKHDSTSGETATTPESLAIQATGDYSCPHA